MSHQPRQSLDTTMLWLALALIAIGLVAISSASVSHAEHFYGNPWRQTLRHMMYLMIGFVAATAAFLPRCRCGEGVTMAVATCHWLVSRRLDTRRRSYGEW